MLLETDKYILKHPLFSNQLFKKWIEMDRIISVLLHILS